MISPTPSFEYVSGNPALDLVNTVDWTSRGPEQERLTDFERLSRWAEGAGVISAREGAALRSRARAKPREAEAAMSAALRARAVLERLFHAVAEGRPPGEAVEQFNRLLSRALERMRLAPETTRGRRPSLQLGWGDRETRLDALIWPVIWSAASLVASDEAAQIRICCGEDCGWMYVDRSRNRLRRWCQMETCGTREKSRRRYQRSRSKGST
jgi:predicted RNA-binding Zn ribbon-like protein